MDLEGFPGREKKGDGDLSSYHTDIDGILRGGIVDGSGRLLPVVSCTVHAASGITVVVFCSDRDDAWPVAVVAWRSAHVKAREIRARWFGEGAEG